MRRKLIRMGASTGVTLPSDWVQQQSLKQGEFVEVTTTHDRIIVSKEKFGQRSIPSHPVLNDDRFEVRSRLYRAYLSGESGIKLQIPAHYSNSWDEVENFVTKVFGVRRDTRMDAKEPEVILQFSEPYPQGPSVPTNLLRSFDHVLQIAQGNLPAFAEPKPDVVMRAEKQAKVFEREIDKYSDYIRRLINKALYDPEFFDMSEIAHRRNALGYDRINSSLERLGDLQDEVVQQLRKLTHDRDTSENASVADCLAICGKLYERCVDLVKQARDSFKDISKSYDLQQLKGFDRELGISYIDRVASAKDRRDLFEQIKTRFGDRSDLLIELHIMQSKIFALGSLAINIAEARGTLDS